MTLPTMASRTILGDTGLAVGPICLGAVASPDTVLAAYDRGVNLFFVSADLHWPLYEAARVGLARLFATRPGARDRVVVAGVSYITQADFCAASFGELVDHVPELGGRLDLLVAGGVYGADEARHARFRAMRAARHLGARAIGASFHDRAAALACINDARFDLAFVRYNPAHCGARQDLFPHIRPSARSRVYGFKSTAGALSAAQCRQLGVGDEHWTPALTDYYRFALTHPQVDGLLCAPQTPAQVHALADALERGALDEEDEQHMLLLAELGTGAASLVEATA